MHNEDTAPKSAAASNDVVASRERGARRNVEMRIYGRNACAAVFRGRPGDVRKIYLTQARISEMKPVLAWCVQNRIGYRVVEAADLDKLTQSQHHEGVCFDVVRQPHPSLSALLQSIPSTQSALLVWLDGVGNPHNLGAILRSAANFGVRGVILSQASGVDVSGAALRVAEGGAESVPITRPAAGEDIFGALKNADFKVAATVPRTGDSPYALALPSRLVLILGAESEGIAQDQLRRADVLFTIPGTGAVESLNVSASAAVLFAEYYRQHAATRTSSRRR